MTPAEWRVAVALATGLSLADAAKRLSISHDTVRGYLQAIFTKTGTRHQNELIVRLLSPDV